MTIALPAPIAAYFEAAKTADAAALQQCFTADATVTDEGQTYTGRSEIGQWKADPSAKYTYTAEPFAIAEKDGLTIVSAHLTGNFPGSPVDLHYRFALKGAQIAHLEIVA